MDAPLRWGLVGCGRVCQAIHVPALAGAADVAVAFDADPDGARWVLDLFPDAVIASDLNELLAWEPDAVSICTPNRDHPAAAIAALQRGVATLCEKPLAATVAEARRVVDAAAASDARFAVNLCYRFHPCFALLRDAVAGAAGPIALELTFSTPGLRLWRPRTSWYGDRTQAGGGALLDIGIHAFDIVSQLVGDVMVTNCSVDDPLLEERAQVQLEFERGDGVVHIDRAARSFALVVSCATPSGKFSLDFRRGELSVDGRVQSHDPASFERAAIEAFAASLSGRFAGALPSAEEGLALQVTIEAAQARAAA